MICNVHGVNPKFLKIGEKVAAEKEIGEQTFSKGAYFLGKMVWAKGYRELIDLLSKHKSDLDGFKLDVYGNGEDANEVQSTAKSLDLNLNFLKGRDHADDSLHGLGSMNLNFPTFFFLLLRIYEYQLLNFPTFLIVHVKRVAWKKHSMNNCSFSLFKLCMKKLSKLAVELI